MNKEAVDLYLPNALRTGWLILKVSEEHLQSAAPIRNGDFNLHFFTPYSMDGKLGRAYNECMRIVPRDEDWVCFLDRDVMFLTPDYGHQIMEILVRNPTAGLLTCLTNRVGCSSQLYLGSLSDDPNILNHRRIAEQLQREHRNEVQQIPAPVSGFLILFRKRIWRDLHFNERLNILGVDWDFTKRVSGRGLPILLMRGVYVFHYYRLEGSNMDTAFLV